MKKTVSFLLTLCLIFVFAQLFPATAYAVNVSSEQALRTALGGPDYEITITGPVSITADLDITADYKVTIDSGATLSINSVANLRVQGNLVNFGTIDIVGKLYINGGLLENDGTIDISSISALHSDNGTIHNNGTINSDGIIGSRGIFVNGGIINTNNIMYTLAGNILNNDNIINNTGIINNAGIIYNSGAINNRNPGVITHDNGGTIDNYPAAITTTSLSSGVVGVLYERFIVASNIDVNDTDVWNITGLPAGMQYEDQTDVCKITGTPAASGSWVIIVTVNGKYGIDQKAFTIVIEDAVAYPFPTVEDNANDAEVEINVPFAGYGNGSVYNITADSHTPLLTDSYSIGANNAATTTFALSADYLQTLSNGTYVIRVNYENGTSVDLTLVIDVSSTTTPAPNPNPNPDPDTDTDADSGTNTGTGSGTGSGSGSGSPRTSDNQTIMIWIVLGGLALAALAVSGTVYVKRKNR
jgi:hypothetical protein